MVPITTDRIVLTGIVTLGSGVQLIWFARRVFQAREKAKITFPAVTGDPDFERVFRAQQNTLEWYPIYMTALWTSTIFLHQVPSAILGVIYIFSRQRYFNGYSRSVEERLPGFFLGARCIMAMLVLSAFGLGRTLLKAGCTNAPVYVGRRVFGGWRFSQFR